MSQLKIALVAFVLASFVLSLDNHGVVSANREQTLQKHNHHYHLKSKYSKNNSDKVPVISESADAPDDDLQVEAEGFFDITEKPEQFLEAFGQIALHTKGKDIKNKSPVHVQRLLELAAASATNKDVIEASMSTPFTGADVVDKKKNAQKNLPAFLFNSDFAKIQSNAKNIENDSGRNFFYERNIIVEPTLPPLEKRIHAENKKVVESFKAAVGRQKKFKPKSKRRKSFKRVLFKQLKGKRVLGQNRHAKRKPRSNHQKKHQTKRNRQHRMQQLPTTAAFGFLSPSSLATHFEEQQMQRKRRAVTAKKDRIWDFGVIPYEIDSIFKSSHKALFIQAMRHWENFTCIKFVERDPRMHSNYIFFTVKSCGCCSFVGKRGDGRQAISIGRNCEKFGIVVHELGHVIGFWHEHTRTDRDEHIIINKANIIKGQEYNFDVLTPEDVDALGLPYDYNSIMHYAKNTFSKSVYLDTIQPIGLSDDDHSEIGQRVRLSGGDVAQANLLYKCSTCGKTFQEISGKIVGPHFYMHGSDGGGGIGSGGSFGSGGIGINGIDGEVGSGDYDGEFDKSLEQCEWRITATNGERIILQVHKLNLLESSGCLTDYLEVRDGYWHKSPVIKRICGNTTSVTIKSDSSRMLVNYVNRNAIKGYQGFIAEFEVICGGDIYLTEDRRIDSPNYPLEYLPDKECIWRITVADNKQVAIKFQSFELENHDNCVYDYVEIRDGNHTDAELIGIFCGHKLPPNIKTNSNQMYLKFVSDGTVQKVGFSALFMEEVDECKFTNHDCQHECINTLGSYQCGCFAGYELQVDGKSCEDACGGIVDARTPNGTLYSPSYPNVYPISKECVWEVVAQPHHAVFLNFTHFDLEGTKYQYTECNYDYLVVYSKLSDGRLKKIGTYCGNELPPVLNSEQNILRLEFYSDKSIQHPGFSARYQTDINECSFNNGGCQHHCRNTFGSYVCSCRNGYSLHENRHNCTETKCKFEITSSYGIIHSPNYPNDYPRNTYCYWHFHSVLGHRVQIDFKEFEVENHQECIYDYVAVHDGKSENDSTLGVYCGEREPFGVLASTNHMFMVLKTDAGLQRKGFTAKYSTECGGYLRATNRSQTFYSHPRYGSRPYKRDMYCNWRIQSDPESSVKIKFLHFEIEYSDRCDYDYLEITEDSSYMRSTNHGRYCGNKKPPTITSYTDSILIRFQSDESTALRGFVVSFMSVEPPDDDLIDDYESVTPFPGYMKSVYYSSDTLSIGDVANDYDDDNRKSYNYNSPASLKFE